MIYLRFCDFFIEYKINVYSIKSTIPRRKLPRIRKIGITIAFIFLITILFFLIIKQFVITYIIFALFMLFLFIFIKIDSKKENMKLMLTEHYKPYSKMRQAALIELLRSYNLDYSDKEKLTWLIQEAEKAKNECDVFSTLKTPIKTLSAIIIPIITYVVTKVADIEDINTLIIGACYVIEIIICLFSIIISLSWIVKDLFQPDIRKYDDLIYDIRQLMLFEPSDKDR